MPSDADGKCDEKKFYPDGIANGYRAISQRYPNHRDGDDFGTQRYGAMFAEVTDVCAEVFLADEPLIELFGTSEVKGSGQ